MPDSVVIYMVAHQPRRPRLPAARLPLSASPRELAEAVFDTALNCRYFQKVAHYCYRPAVAEFARHVDAGLKLNLGFSFSFLRQAQAWEPDLLDQFRRLAVNPNVEIIGVEPYHSFLFWLDANHFQRRMQWMRGELEQIFGKRPSVTDTTEMILGTEIYRALEAAGFRAALAEGRPQLLDWRSPTRVYAPPGGRLRLLTRHNSLSDDVGYRFSNTEWDGYPLRADDYARWIRDTDGDVVVLGWDLETFGEHHHLESGIFEFLRWLPGELRHHGVSSLTASEALDRFAGRTCDLDIPVSPTTWAGKGNMSFFLGNPIQQQVFHLMRHAYQSAILCDDPALLDIALWLAQSDNLHLLQWYNEFSSEAEVSAYFTPDEWWRLGPDRLLNELLQVYHNFIGAISERLACSPHEPALPSTRARREPAVAPPRKQTKRLPVPAS